MTALVAGEPSASDDLEVVDAPPTGIWLAAYAMGLVASEEHMDAVQELRSCLRGGEAAVAEAMDRLHDPVTGDETIRSRARRLLATAASELAAP